MKYFLIFVFCFCSVLKAEVSIRVATDYSPLIGRLGISFKGNNQVLFEWDRNKCAYDNFGSVTACTLMATIIADATLKLIDQNDVYSLYEISGFDQFRLVISQKESKILVMEGKPIQLVQVLPLHPEFSSLSDLF